MVGSSSSRSIVRRSIGFQRAVQSLLAPHVPSSTSSKGAAALFSSGAPSATFQSSLLGSSISEAALPRRHNRWFSTAQISTVEVDVAESHSSDALVSKEDLHKEEKHRVRISDVRALLLHAIGSFRSILISVEYYCVVL